MTTILTEDEFTKEVMQSEVPVLVDFFASWCGPCRAMFPVMDKLNEEFKVFKVDVDKSKNLAKIFNVSALPTFCIFKGGEVVDTFQGVTNIDKIKEKMKGIQ